MEPFSKDDPLYDLLGKTREVEPRPNFTQNVMRSIRNTPQEKLGWWASLLAKLKIKSKSNPNTEWRTAPIFATAAVAAALVLGFAWFGFEFGSTNSNSADPAESIGNPSTFASNDHPAAEPQLVVVAESTIDLDPAIAAFEEIGDTEASGEAAVASELDSMDQLSDLLASQDTSSLTDGEIAMLLY